MDEPRSDCQGWIKAMRSEEAMELVRSNPLAFVLAFVIAIRARRSDRFNANGLGVGEAMIGDYRSVGMSRRQYRTALNILRIAGFAAFRPTTKGTIAKLSDSRLFDVNTEQVGQQVGQRPANGRPLTKKERRK